MAIFTWKWARTCVVCLSMDICHLLSFCSHHLSCKKGLDSFLNLYFFLSVQHMPLQHWWDEGTLSTLFSSLCHESSFGNDSPSECQSLVVSSMTFVHLLLPSTLGGSSLSFEIYVRRSIVGANSCVGWWIYQALQPVQLILLFLKISKRARCKVSQGIEIWQSSTFSVHGDLWN